MMFEGSKEVNMARFNINSRSSTSSGMGMTMDGRVLDLVWPTPTVLQRI